MEIESTTTPYGRPALELLGSQIIELKDGDPLAPVTVLVASNYMALATRRALASRPGGIANVNLMTMRGFAEQFGARHLTEAGRRPVSQPLITSAIRAVLAEAPGLFGAVADHPATEQALTTAYRELRNVTDQAADAVADCSARASDVVRICREARNRLSDNCYDEDDLLIASTQEFEHNPHPEIGPLVIHLLPDLTYRQSDLVSALAARGRLTVNIGLTGAEDADGPVLSAWARASVTPAAPADIDPPCANRIISASDPDDEVRAAVRLVVQWAQQGIRFGRIALLYGNADPYARLVQAQLSAAGIPFSGTSVRSLGDMLFGRTLQAILALPDRDFRRPDVMALLAGAPILHDGSPVPNRKWELISREAGVVRGQDWARRLDFYAASKRARAVRVEHDGSVGQADYLRHDADRADSLAAFVGALRADLARGAEALSWSGLVEWARALIHTYLGDESRRADWPIEEQDCARRIEEALTRVAGLDTLGGPVPSITVFRRTLDDELHKGLPHVGRSGAGVFAGPLSIAEGLEFDRLVVLGMSEGRFPPRRLEDSLLQDAERAAGSGQLKLRADRVHDDYRHLLAAVGGAGESVFCWPRGDLRKSTDRPASRWLLIDAARLAGASEIQSEDLLKYCDEPWLDDIASFGQGLAKTDIFASEQELRLAAIARKDLDHPVLRDDAVLNQVREVVRARASRSFTRFDGNLESVAPELTTPGQVSASRLEKWAACPRSYLFEYILEVRSIEEPEERFTIDPLDRGSLIHEILEKFIQGAIDSAHPFNTWAQADRQRLHQIAASCFERYQDEGRTGRDVLWQRERPRILADLDRVLDRDSQRLGNGLRPVSVEFKFDLPNVPIPGGSVLDLRGTIDRIDQYADGSIEIIDYKSGSDKPYRSLSEGNPHGRGQQLQLYIYALAVRDDFPDAPSVRAFYWFTQSNAFRGYEVTDPVELDVSSVIQTIIGGITAGVFPAHPLEKDTHGGWVQCWPCTPDGLSVAPVRREWDRKRSDPAMGIYTALIDQEAVD